MSSNEYKRSFEINFDKYIRKIIKRQYWKYLKKIKEENKIISLNSKCDDNIEIIDTLVGANDDIDMDYCDYKSIEKLFGNKYVHNAVKSLTDTEKLAIFLCFVLDLKRSDIARIMNLKHKESVTRIANRAIKRIRRKLNNYRSEYDD